MAVSEEVRDNLIHTHLIEPGDINIIRNGIDLNRFYCRRPINSVPRHLLVLSNKIQEEQLRVIKEACDRRGIIFEKVGLPEMNIWEVEEFINNADIVVTIGRGVLESIGCKRVVISYDYNGGDGMVTPDNFYFLRKRNFSGRTHSIQFTVDSFTNELDRYDPRITGQLYDIVYKEHNISHIANQYLKLYSEGMGYFREGRQDKDSGPYLYLAVDELLRDVERSFKEFSAAFEEKDRYIKRLQETLEEKNKYIKDLESALSDKAELKHDVVAKSKSEYCLMRFRISKKIKDLVWKYGIRYAEIIKKLPLLNVMATRVYNRLARERTSSESPDLSS